MTMIHASPCLVRVLATGTLGGLLTATACRKHESPTGAQASSAAAPVVSASASARAAGSAAAPPASSGPRFHVVARAAQVITLSPLGEQALVSSADVPFRLDAAGLHQDPAAYAGLGTLRDWETLTFSGTFPEHTVLVAHPTPDGDPNACRQQTIFTYRGDHWAKQQVLGTCEEVVGVAPWKEDRKIAAVSLAFYRHDWRFALAAGQGPVALPSPTAVPNDPDDFDACRTVQLPESADGTPDGHVFVAGRRCVPKAIGEPVVERWAPDSRKATVDTLPGSTAKQGRYQVLVRSPREAYVVLVGGESAFAARFDGKAWSTLPPPAPGPIAGAVLAPEGALWLAQGRGVHRLQGSGTWESIDVPAPGGNKASVTALGFVGTALYVVTNAGEEQYALLGPASPKEVTRLPTHREISFTEGYDTGPLPATAACANLAVILRHGVAEGQRFPDLTALLGDHPELGSVQLVIDKGPVGDQLVAIVPTMAVGERLVTAVMGKKPKTARPHFVCRKPVIKQKVTL